MKGEHKFYWYCVDGDHPYALAKTISRDRVHRHAFCKNCDCQTLQVSKKVGEHEKGEEWRK